MLKIERQTGRREQKTNTMPKKKSQLARAKDCGKWGGIGGKYLHRGSLFVQGGTRKGPVHSTTGLGTSNDLQGKVFMNQLESPVKAVQLESAHRACQAVAFVEKEKSVNIVSASAESENISSEIRELKELALFYI